MGAITDYLEEPELLDQLAEEAAELAHAACKLSRYRRKLNPVCRSETELVKNLEEELSDVLLCAAQLPYRPDWGVVAKKAERWKERLADMRKEQGEHDG